MGAARPAVTPDRGSCKITVVGSRKLSGFLAAFLLDLLLLLPTTDGNFLVSEFQVFAFTTMRAD